MQKEKQYYFMKKERVKRIANRKVCEIDDWLW